MHDNRLWRFLFSVAIAVLMAGLLLTREEPTPLWVLITYPLVGAALANIASRTSPSKQDIARVETSVIAAAAIFVLASLVNLLLLEMLVTQITAGMQRRASVLERWSLVVLPLVSVLLWWALQRHLSRLRSEAKPPSDQNREKRRKRDSYRR